MRFTAFFLLLLAAVVTPARLWSQHQDIQLWSSIGIRTDITPKLRISLEEEARYFDQLSRLDKLNTDLSLDYQLTESIAFGTLYRLIANRDADGYFDMEHRFDVSVEFQKQVSAWTFTAQATAQKTYPEFNRSRDWYVAEDYLRAEGEISRELKDKKTEPYANLELWYLMPRGRQAFIDQYRLTFGVKHRIKKINRLNFYYRIQQEIQVNDPLFAHIIGIGYTYVWKR
jgi:hypothetical protein